MSEQEPKAEKPAETRSNLPFGMSMRELIYAAILVLGFALIMSGLNGALEWGLPELATNVLGGLLGIAAAFVLSWLRNR